MAIRFDLDSEIGRAQFLEAHESLVELMATQLSQFYRQMIEEGVPDSLAHQLTIIYMGKMLGTDKKMDV